MRRLRFLLRPGWLAVAAVVALFAYLCFTVLAPWQLGKNTSTSHRNDLINQSVDAEPVALEELLTPTGFADDDEWRRVVATGVYESDKEVLVRLRSIREQPAYEVITPFRLDSGETILVNRGYVLPVQGTQPPTIEPAPTGEVTLDARIRRAEGTSREPIEEAGHIQVYNINPDQIGTALSVTPVQGYLQLDDAQPGGLGVIELPQTDSGPYLSYGLQWLAFGIMAPLGLAYFVRAEWRERRKATNRDLADPTDDDRLVPELDGPLPDSTVRDSPAPDSPAPDSSAPTVADPEPEFTLPTRRERKSRAKSASSTRTAQDARLADRYGKGR